MPECDVGANNREIPFNQSWLENAIPFSDGKINQCQRFAPMNRTIADGGECSADMFDTSLEIACSEYIHASDEINVQTEVNQPSNYPTISSLFSFGKNIFVNFS